MRGCLSILTVLLFLWALGTTYYIATDEPEEPSEYSEELPKIPERDTTREVEEFDFRRLIYIYKDSIKLEDQRQPKKKNYQYPIDNYEKQMIIDGKRYRLQHRSDGTHLIPIR